MCIQYKKMSKYRIRIEQLDYEKIKKHNIRLVTKAW